MNSITYIVTDKCNIRCDFCAPECGPEYKVHLNSKSMIKIFSDVESQMKVPLVVFTGGEPMLFKNEILETMVYIKNTSPETTIRVVTNVFWASSFASAKKIIDDLITAGISELNISVDDFHQKFIPEKNIQNIVSNCIDFKLRVLLAHKSYPNSITDKEYYENLLDMEIIQISKSSKNDFSKGIVFYSSGYTVPIGRGSSSVDKETWLPQNYTDKRWIGPCEEVLKSYTISPDGSLMPCCGLVSRDIGIFYGSNVIENNIAQEMEKHCNSFLYNWLALEGPSSILDFIKLKDPSIKFSTNFIQNCQVCQELFSNQKVLHIISENMDELSLKLSVSRCLLDAKRETLIESL